MSSVNYMMITVASVEAAQTATALQQVRQLADELKQEAGAIATRFGVIATGNYSGHLVLFQGYDELNGVDRALSVYGRSETYQALIATPSMEVVLRNIWKLEQIAIDGQSSEPPAYGVVTRFASSDLMLESMRELLAIFEQNGATVFRYGTMVTGSACGRRLLGVGYPSMDAIEKTYRALRDSPAYLQALAEIDMDWRNIIRFEG